MRRGEYKRIRKAIGSIPAHRIETVDHAMLRSVAERARGRLDLAERWRTHARAIDEPAARGFAGALESVESVVAGSSVLARDEAYAGDLDAARTIVDGAIARALEARARLALAEALVLRFRIELEGESLEVTPEVWKTLRHAAVVAAAEEDAVARTLVLAHRFWIAAWRGDFADARRFLDVVPTGRVANADALNAISIGRALRSGACGDWETALAHSDLVRETLLFPTERAWYSTLRALFASGLPDKDRWRERAGAASGHVEAAGVSAAARARMRAALAIAGSMQRSRIRPLHATGDVIAQTISNWFTIATPAPLLQAGYGGLAAVLDVLKPHEVSETA
jgi:hypothetical protein